MPIETSLKLQSNLDENISSTMADSVFITITLTSQLAVVVTRECIHLVGIRLLIWPAGYIITEVPLFRCAAEVVALHIRAGICDRVRVLMTIV